jgi:hypothetical protein
MHNSPISKDFYKDIVNVLSGKTTTKVELPVSLVESANQASLDLAHAFLDGGTVSLEKKRDILRKNLKEGAAKCGCTLNPDMIARFEELSAQAPVAVKANEVAEEVAETEEAVEEVEIADTEKTETSSDQLVEMSAGLTQFIAQLNQDEVRILKNLLSNH